MPRRRRAATIAKAASLAQPNKTVWLNNGAYPVASQPAPIQIPAGLTLRALTPGLAGVGQAIVLQGNATVVGVVLRRVATGDSGWIEASSGMVTIDGVKAQGPYFAGGLPPLTLSGTVQVTMTPGNIADYTDALPAVGQNAYTYAQLSDTARLTVNGGFFGGAVLGGADGLYGGQGRGAFRLFGGARLDLNNVQLNVDSTGVFMGGSATQLHVNGSTIQSNVNTGPGYAIHAASGPATIVLVNSTISGFRYGYAHNSRGILVGQYNIAGAAATLTVTNSTVTGNDVGIWAVHGTTPSTLTMTGSGASVSGNAFGGVVCYADCAFDITGGQVSGNGVTDPTLVNGVSDFYGGFWLGSTLGLPAQAAQRQRRRQQERARRQLEPARQLRHHDARQRRFDLRPRYRGEPGQQRDPGQHDGQPDDRPPRRRGGRSDRERGGQHLRRRSPGSERPGPVPTRHGAVRCLELQPDHGVGRELPDHQRHPAAGAVAGTETRTWENVTMNCIWNRARGPGAGSSPPSSPASPAAAEAAEAPARRRPGKRSAPTAGSVTSSDGKVTVSVGDNALQGATTIAIAPAEPDAATAADPSLRSGNHVRVHRAPPAGAGAGADPHRLAARGGRRRGRDARPRPHARRCRPATSRPRPAWSIRPCSRRRCRTSGSTATSVRRRRRRRA